ncbi:MAG: hypothetical protein EOP49_17070, partial [Sphingobacteriales bacterium]
MTIQSGMTATQNLNITQTINAYSKRLMGFIRKRVNSEADAEDILQDVFYQFIGNTQPIDQVTSWLFTVARNKIIDRKRKHKPELLDDIYAEKDDDLSFDWTDKTVALIGAGSSGIQLLPQIQRPLATEELALLGNQINQPSVLAGLGVMLAAPAQREPVLIAMNRLDRQTAANPELAKIVAGAVKQLLAEKRTSERERLAI